MSRILEAELRDPRWTRRDRIYVPRNYREGEVWTDRGQWCDRRYFAMLVNSYRHGGGAPAGLTYYLNTDGSNGDGSIGTPWNTMQNARAGIIGLHASLVADTVNPTLICTGAADDTTAVTNTWPTSSTTYYLTIKVPDADRKGQFDGSKYALAVTASGSPAWSLGTNSIRLQGLQIYQMSTTGGSDVLSITSLGGEFVADGCKFAASASLGGNAAGVRASNIGGAFVFRNCLIVNPQHGMLIGNPTGLLTGSTVIIYNGTIWGTGSGGEACQITFAAGGSSRVARVKNMMMYAQTNGISVANSDTNDQATNTKGGTDASHFEAAGNPPSGDWRTKSTSAANVDTGTDLSAVGAGQWQFSEDVSLYTRPYNGTWDRGFYEYRP